jgi:hypothetical protein
VRRCLLVLALIAAGAVAGTAGAATIVGTPRADVLRGTARADFLDGLGGRDRILARAGNDRVRAQDGLRDTVACGPGRDLVNADRLDALARDCEVVSRQISSDPYRDELGQHASQVEPDTFAFGSTIVSVFQSGRVFDGGASNTGFATSLDGGRSWRSGFMPGLTPGSSPPGTHERASDPVIAYDARHRVWLATSLLVSPGRGGAIVVNRSPDGLRWGPPVTVAETARDLLLDKQWLVCDNGVASPFAGSCYMAYSDFRTIRMSLQTSRDGGLTWSAPVGSPDDAGRTSMLGRFAPAPQPLVRPDGVLVIPFHDEFRLAAVRSLDGGVSLTTATAIAPADFDESRILRDPPLPSAEIAGDGKVFVVWPDCGLRPACSGNDLVVSSSADGVTWTPKRRIPTGTSFNSVLPGLAVDPASAGARTRLAVAYYTTSALGLDVHVVASSDGGATWSAPQRLSAQTMSLQWIPATTGGLMVGDYISTSFVNGNAVPVFAIASRPRRLLNQAMFEAVLPVR